jgi:hypothetical protein
MFEAVRMPELAGCSSDGQIVMVATERKEDIKLNGKRYSSWQQASDAFLALQGKAKSGSVWDRLIKFDTGNAGNGSFELRCKKCGHKCQMMNPSKWQDHTEDACTKRASKATGAVSHAMNLFMPTMPHRARFGSCWAPMSNFVLLNPIPLRKEANGGVLACRFQKASHQVQHHSIRSQSAAAGSIC